MRFNAVFRSKWRVSECLSGSLVLVPSRQQAAQQLTGPIPQSPVPSHRAQGPQECCEQVRKEVRGASPVLVFSRSSVVLPILSLLFVSVTPRGMWDFSFLTQGEPLRLTAEARNPNHWTSRGFPGLVINLYIIKFCWYSCTIQ